MKQLHLSLLLALMLFGCQGINEPDPTKPNPEPEPEPEVIEIIVNTPEITVGEGLCDTVATFSSTAAWSIEASETKATPDWFEVSPKSGDAGDATLAIRVTKVNEFQSDRNAYIKIRSGKELKFITLTQKKFNSIILSKDRFDIGADGGEFAVQVKSNITYEVDIPTGSKNWIHRSAQANSSEEKFIVSSASEDSSRSGIVVFSSGNLRDTVHVFQPQKNYVYIGQVRGNGQYYYSKGYSTYSASEQFGVYLRTNIDYDITIKDSWAKQVQTRAIRVDVINFEVDENVSYDNRSTEIIFKDRNSSLADTLKLNQVPKDFFKLSKKSVNLSNQAQTFEVEVQSNTPYSLFMHNWIEQVNSSTKAIESKTLTFKVAQNTDVARTGMVVFYGGYGGYKDTLLVNQERVSYIDVEIKTAGTLVDVLSSMDPLSIFALRIKGPMNIVDFGAINASLPYLRLLDLENVIIDSIHSRAFRRSGLRQVTLPKTIIGIGDGAFAGCPLTSIVIPASVGIIGSSAFAGCPLTSITIPASVETIGASAFNNCSKLERVTFEAGSKLKTIGGGYSSSYYYGVFSDCSALTSITIPASVETIEASAFKNCPKLERVTFEAGSRLKTIGGGYSSSYYYGVFSDCSALASITIPASVETIEANAFKNCPKLERVTFEAGSKLKTIGGGYSSSSSSYDNDSYSYGAFSDCAALTSIAIPASVETIEASAFKNCSKLARVTFEAGSRLKTIGGGYYFYDSSYNPYSHSYGAFSDCSALTSIAIPASVETIEASAFKNCSKLERVTFEAGSRLKTIGGGYFSFSSSYNNRYYYYGAFSDCSALTSIAIPASIEVIGESAFFFCSSLTTVDAERCKSIKSIESTAFYYCSKLWLFKIGTVVPPVCASYVFEINPSSILQVPTESIEAYRAATGWKGFSQITWLAPPQTIPRK